MWLAVAVLAVAVACGLALGLVVRMRSGGARAPRPRPIGATLDPAELRDVASRLDALDPDEVRQRDELLARRLRPLIAKRVPARVVEPVRGLHTVRIRFADGTAVTGHGETPGDAGVLAAMLRRQAVFLAACEVDADGTHLRFARAGRSKLVSFVATGFDQPE